MAISEMQQRFAQAAMALGANRDIKTAKAFAEKYRQNPDRYDNAAQGVIFTRNTYGNASFGFTPEQYGQASAQFQYYKDRTARGYDPVEIKDLNWNPALYDDATNEALGEWYKSNKSLPNAYQAAEFSNFLAQYKQERDAADIKDQYRLAGYDKAGTTKLKFSDAWKKYGFGYDMTDADDIRRSQVGMPPKAFLDLYTTDGAFADEDTRRLENGEIPVVLDPLYGAGAQTDMGEHAPTANFTDPQGHTGRGNINLDNVRVPPSGNVLDGMRAFSLENGQIILVPAYVGGQMLSDEQAWQRYLDTRKNYGLFNTAEEADEYVQQAFGDIIRQRERHSQTIRAATEMFKGPLDGFKAPNVNSPVIAEHEAALALRQATAPKTVDEVKAAAQAEIDKLYERRDQEIAENEALRIRKKRGVSEFTGYRDIDYSIPQQLVIDAPVTQENVEKGAADRRNKYATNGVLGHSEADIITATHFGGSPYIDPQRIGVVRITPAEAQIINAYYGAGDYAAGNKVFAYFRENHAREYNEEEAEKAAQASGVAQVGRSLVSFAPQAAYAVETAANAAKNLFTGENTPVPESAASGQTRKAAAGEADLLKDLTPAGRFWAQAALGTGKMLPMLATGAAAPWFMGFSAGGQASLDAKDRGATGGQQFFQGLTQGVAEGLFEKWSLGALKAFKPVKAAGVKGALRELAKLGFVNATEEVFTDVSNMLTDAVIMEAFGDGKSESEIRQLYEARINNGEPVDAARWGVVGDIATKLLNTAAVGAVMGLTLGGGKVLGEAASSAGTRAEQGAAAQEPPTPSQSVTDAPQAIAGQGQADTPAQQQNAVQGQETANTQYAQQDAQRREVAQMRSQAEAVIETLPAEQQDTAREVLTQWQNENNAARANPNVVMFESRDSIDTVTDSRMQSAERLGKALGVNVQWAESISRPNGQTAEALYDAATGTITIAVEADAPYHHLFGREFTHHLEQSDGYDAMRGFVVQQLQQRGDYDAAMQVLSDTYQTNDTAVLERALVADYAKNVLFADEATVRYFVRSQSGLGGRILNWITDTLAKLGGQNSEAAAQLRRARDLWAAAMQGERGANVDATQGLAQAEQGIPAPTNEQQPQAQSDRRIALSESGALAEGSQYSLRSDPLDAMLASYGLSGTTTARVLTKTTERTPPLSVRAAEFVRSMIRKFSDAGNEIVRIGRISKDSGLYQNYDWARRSRAIADNMIFEAQYDINGAPVGESLQKIFEPIKTRDEAYQSEAYSYLYHLHNIDRMTLEERGYGNNKPVFGEHVTADMSRAEVQKAEAAHPEFKAFAAAVNKYNANLMRWRVDSGLVSQDLANELNKMYPNYVPTYRVLPKTGGVSARGTATTIDPGLRRAKGSNLDLVPIDVSMARQTLQTISAAKRNQFGLNLLANARKHARVLGDFVAVVGETTRRDALAAANALLDADPADPNAPNSWTGQNNLPNSFTVFENGEAVTIQVNKALAEGLHALEPASYDAVDRLANRAMRGFKALITNYSPLFTIRNVLRDQQDGLLFSESPMRFAKNLTAAVSELSRGSEDAKLYRAMGGYATTMFENTRGLFPEHGKLRNALEYLPKRIEALNILTEQATRFAEFKAVLQREGRTPEGIRKALYASAEVTVNFSRAGTTGRRLNSVLVPFFNPAMQGASKAFRSFSGQNGWKAAKNTAVRAALFGIAPAVLNHMLFGDDEDYAQLPDRIKWSSWVFKIAPQKFLVIPTGRVLSVFGAGAKAVLAMIDGESPDWSEYGAFVVSQSGPVNPLTSNIFSPMLAMGTNQTWYGSPIETAAMQNLPMHMRYDEKTDAISKWLGRWNMAQRVGLSPKKINYLLDAYTGVLGDLALPILAPYAERNGFVKAFVADTVLTNRAYEDFYNTIDDLTKARNEPDAPTSTAYILSYMNLQSKNVSELNKQARAVQNSTELTDAQKLEKVRELRALSNAIMSEALRSLPTYAEIATAHNPPDFGSGEGIERAKAKIDYDAFGAEYALRNYFNEDTFTSKVQQAKDKGLSYEKYYQAYFAIKDIKEQYANVHEKDKYGNNEKLITNNDDARKAAVMDYINKVFKNPKERELVIAIISGYSSASTTSTSSAPRRVGFGDTQEDKPVRGKIQ